jgi:DnaJ-class molecular chaperone
MGKGKRTATDKMFNPEKYGMAVCPLCKGKGKIRKKPDKFNVCTGCGGFGLIKKEKEPPENMISVSKSTSTYEEE